MRSFCCLLLLTGLVGAADWPQWMGPNRDGIWDENGIVDKLPVNGPPRKWSAPLAGGYSGPAVAQGKVYVMDYVKKQGNDKPDPGRRNELIGEERIVCLDSATGQEKWIEKYNCAYSVSYPAGPRCTPTVHNGLVYALGTMGKLSCLDAETGKPRWQHDLTEKFKAKTPIWGFAGHPLIHKNLLICTVGGAGSLLVAFDKDNGTVKWQALTAADDDPGYCPPSLLEAGGVTQLLLWHPTAIVSLNPDDGKVYWKESLKPLYGMSIMMPRRGGDLLYAGGIGNAGLAVRLNKDTPTANVAWRGLKDNALYPANSTPLIVDDIMYGVDVSGHLRAVELSTGKRLWETTDPTVEAPNKPTPHGTAFLVKNGNRFFLFNEKGSLIIAELNAKEYKEISKAKLIEPTTPAFNRTVVWSHPAFAEKCIFVRNDKEIACYSLK